MLSLLPTLSLLALPFASSVVQARKITVINSCDHTVWPGLFPATESAPTGWEAPSGDERTFEVADNWTSGRIWGRTGCDFSDPKNVDASTCVSGGCPGGLECNAWANLPATLAEFGLGQWNNVDFYDISLVDGYNLPLSITPSDEACTAPSCAADLNYDCPAELRASFDDSGDNQGCKTACSALGGDANCCTGPNSTPETCPTSGVAHYDYFKGACKDAYVMAYDEGSGTALFGCNTSPDYTIEFCPCS